MQSTLSAAVPEYLGADLTDRYSAQCRAIDVCGLTPAGSNRLQAAFWYWRWDPAPQPLDIAAIATELRAARVVMVDGPQALARKGDTLRLCEKHSAAVGKTPDSRPPLTRPFAGFICSSLDLFTALALYGIPVSPPQFAGGISEVYPGHIWTILSGGRGLPNKASAAGRLARRRILGAFGVCGLPDLPSHDQNDACVAALLAAVADNRVPGLTAVAIGAPLSVDGDGSLREGPMIIPQLTDPAVGRIAGAICDDHVPEPPPPRVLDPAAAASEEAADELLANFIAKALEGDPQVCTYAWAWRTLFHASPSRFSQAYARRVIDLARRTRPRQLPGLGLVRLDAFIVSKQHRVPSEGYWPAAEHHRDEWRVRGQLTR